MNYKIENILKQLKERENYYEQAAKSLKKITRNKTKSGKDFALLQKNFTCCTIRAGKYSLYPEEKELEVYFYSDKYGYNDYSFKLYRTIDKTEMDKYIEKNGTIVIYTFRTFYVYSADEVAEKIAEQIESCEKEAAEYAEKIANIQQLETEAEKIREAVQNSSFKYELLKLLNEGYCY